MKLSKKIFAGIFAVTLAAGITACGNVEESDSKKEDNNTSSVSENNEDDSFSFINGLMDKGSKSDSQSSESTLSSNTNSSGTGNEKQSPYDYEKLAAQLPDRTLENKTVKIMSYDIFYSDPDEPENPGIELFNVKYGGKVEYVQTTWDNRYSDLAKLVCVHNSPEMFPADDMDAFPRGAIKEMFDPIDDYVDLNSDLWKSSKSINDLFMIDGKHYVAANCIAPEYVCVYNTRTIEDNQLDDPAELYKNDEWTFSKFAEMCEEFTDATTDKYGLDGYYYYRALNNICGVPLIGMSNGKLVSNLENKKVCNIQNKMYELEKKEICFPKCDNDWKTRGEGKDGEGIGSNLTLFEPIGLYALEQMPNKTKLFGDIKNGEVMFVPMPRMDDESKYYTSVKAEGYLLCHGSANPKGFGTLVNCIKLAKDETNDIYNENLKSYYGWTEEMVEMRKEVFELAKKYPVFDFSYGVTSELKQVMENNVNNATMVTGGGAMTWTECVQNYKKYVDSEINKVNEKM